MSIYATTQPRAQAIAAALTAIRIGKPATLSDNANSVVTGYLVKPHSWSDSLRDTPLAWGVIERWRYADRPDLPEMGGAFIDIHRAERLTADTDARHGVL